MFYSFFYVCALYIFHLSIVITTLAKQHITKKSTWAKLEDRPVTHKPKHQDSRIKWRWFGYMIVTWHSIDTSCMTPLQESGYGMGLTRACLEP